SLGFGPTDGAYASVFVGWSGLFAFMLLGTCYWLGTVLSDVTRAGDGSPEVRAAAVDGVDRKSTRLNSSHVAISYGVFCLKKKIRHGVHDIAKRVIRSHWFDGFLVDQPGFALEKYRVHFAHVLRVVRAHIIVLHGRNPPIL